MSGSGDYVSREAFLAEQRHLYCENCARRKGMKNGKMKFVYEIGDAPCRACGIGDVLDDVENFPAADVRPRWIPVTERLPEEPGMYIVFLRCGAELQDPWFPEDLSYVTAMHFDSDQRIWNDGIESYNANLDVVNKPHAYYITHWMPLPQPPKGGE